MPHLNLSPALIDALMHGALPAWSAVLFAPLFSYLDRDVGDGAEAGLSRVTANEAAIVVGGILGLLVFGLAFAPIGLLWVGCRSIGFRTGTLDPQTPAQALWCLARYLVMVPICILAVIRGDPWWTLGAPLLVAVLVDVAMRLDFGAAAKKAQDAGVPIHGDPEAMIERLSGSLFGGALFFYAVLPWHALAAVVTS